MQIFAFDPILVALVTVAAVTAMLLIGLRARRYRWALVLLQLPAAALLLGALLLRDADDPVQLVVLAPGAESSAIAAVRGHEPMVALPGATPHPGADAVPDLATALRSYPTLQRLHVIGDHLAQHDLDAARGFDVSVAQPAASSAPRFIDIDAPASAVAGAWWNVRGRVANAAGLSVELRDPSDAVLGRSPLDTDGRFTLRGLSRAAGPALFALHLRDGERDVQVLPLPLTAIEAAPLRVLVLAAAPSPELKSLRRWALDAGLDLQARIDLAPGLPQRRGDAALDAASLAQLDLLVVDERSWAQLAALQPSLREAIANGLGLLLRITGPIPERVARDWNALGIDIALTQPQPREVALDVAGGPLHAWVASDVADSVALLRDAAGVPLATRRPLGQGRIGTWTLTDTYRLVTRGERETHATLWADAVTAVARARGAVQPLLPTRAVVGERAVVCTPDAAARVVAPSGHTVELLRDAGGGCAAFWPVEPGWHRLQSSDEGATAASLFVYPAADAASLSTHALRTQTTSLANRAGPLAPQRLNRDPWRAVLLGAWLLLAAIGWWLERRARPAAGD